MQESLRMTGRRVEALRELARVRLAGRRSAMLELGALKPAAVLVLIYPKAGVEHLLLTMRTEIVEHHKGQISLPGGGVHGDDLDLEATALRETFEEVGILPDDVEVLGRLDDVVTVSNFRVTPVVGLLREAPSGFTPSPFEVAEVIEVPVAHLLDPANCIEERRERNGVVSVASAYEFDGYLVRGVTARILRGFLDLLSDGPEQVTR
jgi:8-oxo-dGTP pyrophosphatase MutT (NUDIX family)